MPPAPPRLFPLHQLDAKLRDALAGRSSLFAEGAAGAGLAASLQRPLLCLFDRNFELSVVLQHAWTYKPLVGFGGREGRACRNGRLGRQEGGWAGESQPWPGAGGAAALRARLQKHAHLCQRERTCHPACQPPTGA